MTDTGTIVWLIAIAILISWMVYLWRKDVRKHKAKLLRNKDKTYRITAKYSDDGAVIYYAEWFCHWDDTWSYGWNKFTTDYTNEAQAQGRIDAHKVAVVMREKGSWVVKEPA